MATDQNLILCLAANYKFADIAPFVVSKSRHVKTADLVIFSANMDEEFDSAVERYAISVMKAGLEAYPAYHPQTARFFRYKDFLAESRGRYAQVLITDVRDVIFQGDPFAIEHPRPVSFAAEDRTIGNCPINTRWLQSNYGEAVAADLAERPISCSGTTIGRFEEIVAYVDLMCDEAARTRCADVGGIDQGFHNYIAWKLAPPFVAVDMDDRIVNTIGYTHGDQLSIEGNRVLVEGHFSPVVHQWDRHASVAQAMKDLYDA